MSNILEEDDAEDMYMAVGNVSSAPLSSRISVQAKPPPLIVTSSGFPPLPGYAPLPPIPGSSPLPPLGRVSTLPSSPAPAVPGFNRGETGRMSGGKGRPQVPSSGPPAPTGRTSITSTLPRAGPPQPSVHVGPPSPSVAPPAGRAGTPPTVAAPPPRSGSSHPPTLAVSPVSLSDKGSTSPSSGSEDIYADAP